MLDPKHHQSGWGTVPWKGLSGQGQSASSHVSYVGWLTDVNLLKCTQSLLNISVHKQSVWNTSASTSWSASRQQTSAVLCSQSSPSQSWGQSKTHSLTSSVWETANQFKKNVCCNWSINNERNTWQRPRTLNTVTPGTIHQYRSDFRSAPLCSCHTNKELSIIYVDNIKPHRKVGWAHDCWTKMRRCPCLPRFIYTQMNKKDVFSALKGYLYLRPHLRAGNGAKIHDFYISRRFCIHQNHASIFLNLYCPKIKEEIVGINYPFFLNLVVTCVDN